MRLVIASVKKEKLVLGTGDWSTTPHPRMMTDLGRGAGPGTAATGVQNDLRSISEILPKAFLP